MKKEENLQKQHHEFTEADVNRLVLALRRMNSVDMDCFLTAVHFRIYQKPSSLRSGEKYSGSLSKEFLQRLRNDLEGARHLAISILSESDRNTIERALEAINSAKA